MSSYTPIADETRIEILTALATGRIPSGIAADTALPLATVLRVAKAHGYPNLSRITAALQELDQCTEVQREQAMSTTELLLEVASQSARRQTRDAAARITRMVTLLEERVAYERELDRIRAVQRANRVAERTHTTPVPRVDAGDVRAWARGLGIPTPERGQLPHTLIRAYVDAQQTQQAKRVHA